MLLPDAVGLRELLGEKGALSKALRAYEAREEQITMASAVEKALQNSEVLLVEAGTGTGKSLAYLLPAVRSHMTVVVSTATKALGEQLLERDLPTLAKLGLHPEVALVKGLGNYVCRRRLEEHRRTVVTGGQRGDVWLPAVLRWIEETETGDRADALKIPDDAAVWREITSSSETRVGPKCRYYEQCFVTQMRRRAEEARIIITNHHLFCADLAVRGANTGSAVLPSYDAVIFDEAHALEEVATEFFGVRITRARIEALGRDAARAFESSGFFVDPLRASNTSRLLTGLVAAGAEVFARLPRAGAGATELGTSGRILVRAEQIEGPLGDALKVLDAQLEELGASIRDFVSGSEALLSLGRRVVALREALTVVRDAANPANVVFAEPDARGGGALGASPIEVGPLFATRLWSQGKPVILTSATLSSGAKHAPAPTDGSTDTEDPFTFVRRRLGVPKQAQTLSLPSPFDYGAQAALYIPRGIPEPRDERYLSIATDEMVKLINVTRGGAFVLCTSVRAMRAFAEALRDRLAHPVYLQGEAPKQALLQRFRRDGDAVLVATSSFWEGVDVPGRALRLVLIDKLPFEAPNDPVVAARIARLQEQGRDPFDDYQVPLAALALKQGFGRLIRTKRDAGIVAILDRRLLTRRYGQTLLDALPPASRCSSIDEVAAFWASVDEQPAEKDEAVID